jgi:hypothetical protein
MNSGLFEEWFAKFLLALKEPSIIVLDNASYHSRKISKNPQTHFTKSMIMDWLDKHSIDYQPTMFKTTLLDLCRKHRVVEKYFVDELALEHGHEVLRLPLPIQSN